MLVLVALVLPVTALVGCGSDESGGSLVDDATEVTYHFYDSSVPPEYHRSYVVTATDGEVHIVVDSYGDVLHDETTSLDAATFDTVLEDIDGLESSEAEDDGCTGGTSSELIVTDADDSVLLSISTSSCGDDGVDGEQLEQIVAPLLAGFDMDTLLAPGE